MVEHRRREQPRERELQHQRREAHQGHAQESDRDLRAQGNGDSTPPEASATRRLQARGAGASLGATVRPLQTDQPVGGGRSRSAGRRLALAARDPLQHGRVRPLPRARLRDAPRDTQALPSIRDGCGYFDLRLPFTSTPLPLRAYYYIGSLPALPFYPFWRLVDDPVAARLAGACCFLLCDAPRGPAAARASGLDRDREPRLPRLARHVPGRRGPGGPVGSPAAGGAPRRPARAAGALERRLGRVGRRARASRSSWGSGRSSSSPGGSRPSRSSCWRRPAGQDPSLAAAARRRLPALVRRSRVPRPRPPLLLLASVDRDGRPYAAALRAGRPLDGARGRGGGGAAARPVRRGRLARRPAQPAAARLAARPRCRWLLSVAAAGPRLPARARGGASCATWTLLSALTFGFVAASGYSRWPHHFAFPLLAAGARARPRPRGPRPGASGSRPWRWPRPSGRSLGARLPAGADARRVLAGQGPAAAPSSGSAVSTATSLQVHASWGTYYIAQLFGDPARMLVYARRVGDDPARLRQLAELAREQRTTAAAAELASPRAAPHARGRGRLRPPAAHVAVRLLVGGRVPAAAARTDLAFSHRGAYTRRGETRWGVAALGVPGRAGRGRGHGARRPGVGRDRLPRGAHGPLRARSSEVLDRLGRQIGMKVVYEGASPRQLVTLSLQGRSPAETVLGLARRPGPQLRARVRPDGHARRDAARGGRRAVDGIRRARVERQPLDASRAVPPAALAAPGLGPGHDGRGPRGRRGGRGLRRSPLRRRVPRRGPADPAGANPVPVPQGPEASRTLPGSRSRSRPSRRRRRPTRRRPSRRCRRACPAGPRHRRRRRRSRRPPRSRRQLAGAASESRCCRAARRRAAGRCPGAVQRAPGARRREADRRRTATRCTSCGR